MRLALLSSGQSSSAIANDPDRPIHMSSAETDRQNSPAVAPPILWWLRLEGLAVAVLSAVLYARAGSSWWLFAALWLVPDLSFVGYLAGPRWGAHCYNTVHSYILPVVVSAIAILFHEAAPIPFALLWFNHIG